MRIFQETVIGSGYHLVEIMDEELDKIYHFFANQLTADIEKAGLTEVIEVLLTSYEDRHLPF